jgi:hypothetical protein
MPKRLGGMTVLLDFLPQACRLSWIWVDQAQIDGEKFTEAVKQPIESILGMVFNLFQPFHIPVLSYRERNLMKNSSSK